MMTPLFIFLCISAAVLAVFIICWPSKKDEPELHSTQFAPFEAEPTVPPHVWDEHRKRDIR
jgi:hypothetical protein